MGLIYGITPIGLCFVAWLFFVRHRNRKWKRRHEQIRHILQPERPPFVPEEHFVNRELIPTRTEDPVLQTSRRHSTILSQELVDDGEGIIYFCKIHYLNVTMRIVLVN